MQSVHDESALFNGTYHETEQAHLAAVMTRPPAVVTVESAGAWPAIRTPFMAYSIKIYGYMETSIAAGGGGDPPVPLVSTYEKEIINSQTGLSYDTSALFNANGGTILATGGYAISGDTLPTGWTYDADTGELAIDANADDSTNSPYSFSITAENEYDVSDPIAVTINVYTAVRIGQHIL